MTIKVSVPNRVRLKVIPSFRNVLLASRGEIHYIGGSEVLPPPLDPETEGEMIALLGTDQEKEARSKLIEHNLRLVVYIAKKFDNTGVGVEDLISIGTIGLIKAVNTYNSRKNELLLSDILGTDDDVISRGVEEEAEMKLLNMAIARLAPREKKIVELRYGINSDTGEEKTQKEVADILGISQSYISRLEKKIIKRLKKEIVRFE